MARTDRPSEAGGGGSGRGGNAGGFSYRASELRPAERRVMREQNRSAESMKNKNLDAMDSAKKAAQTRKLNQEAKEDYAYSKGSKDAFKKAAGAGAVAIIAAEEAGRAAGKKQGTQSGHAVTSGKNTTKPVK